MNQDISTKQVLGDEGFRLFFMFGAIYAAIWPLQWVLFSFDLPFSQRIPTSFWHGHELIYGAFGAALIGFMTTAIPEWTNTKKLQGNSLFLLAGLWFGGRIIGFWGLDYLAWLGAIFDSIWLFLLMAYVIKVSTIKKTTKFSAFIIWIGGLGLANLILNYSFISTDFILSKKALHLATYCFLGLLSLALARITIGVTNLILAPDKKTAPYRPHPGRLNMVSGLIAIVAIAELFNVSPAIIGYLLIAAGAGFMDRTAEWFVGREALKSELAILGFSSLLAGSGLIIMGISRLGAPVAEITGLHIALMGGLGMGVLAVFSIAGLLHAHQPLAFSMANKIAMICLLLAVICRVLPDFGFLLFVPISPYFLATLFWFLAFATWAFKYWPILSDPQTIR